MMSRLWVGLVPFIIAMAAAAVPSFAQTTRPLIVCSFAYDPPFVMKTQGKAGGIDVDLMVALLRDMEQPATLNLVTTTKINTAIKEGACDVVFPVSMQQEDTAEGTLLRTVPFRYQSYSLFRLKTSDQSASVDRVGDLLDMRLGMTADFKLTVGVQQAILDKRIQALIFEDRAAMVQALRDQKIDGIVDQAVPLRYVVQGMKLRQRIHEAPITFIAHSPLFLAFAKTPDKTDQEGLMSKFEAALKRQHLRGELLRYMAAYLQ